MKARKRITSIVVLFLFTILFSTMVEAQRRRLRWRLWRQSHQTTQVQPQTVGAPLDGGLLALLAAAGGVYFVARRKKKKQE
jgi:hypothetical protein